jgi:hypothetical protein
MILDLNKDEHAYIYGLLLADGNLYLNKVRNRGKVMLELSERDKDILYKISNTISGGQIHFRERITNFTNGNIKKFYIWANSHIEFRYELIEYGFPIKNKSLECNVPNIFYDEAGFWRGYMDGNGSVGITSQNIPFMSVTMKSENLKNSYLKFLLNNFNIEKLINRNKRDNIYNISVLKEDAQEISKFLYHNNTISIQRKYNNYLEVMGWVRPVGMKVKPWLSGHV